MSAAVVEKRVGRKPSKASADVRANIVRLVQMGWTYSMIAEELRLSKGYVGRVVTEAGVRSAYRSKAHSDPQRKKEQQERSEFFERRRFRSVLFSSGTWEPDDDTTESVLHGIVPESETP